MTTDEGRKPEGAAEPLAQNWRRRPVRRRREWSVARLLRGEPLDLVAWQTNVSIARLTQWRDRALAGAVTALKETLCRLNLVPLEPSFIHPKAQRGQSRST
jgi:hypothetical protein